MSKVIAVCGKICSGKSTYAEAIRLENQAVILSVDEIMLSLFGQDAGEMHDIYAERIQRFLLGKSVDLIETGVSVILDWGFWTREKRNAVKAFYRERNILCELHYIDVSDGILKMRIEQRNAAVLAGKNDAYFVDDGLAEKCSELFEVPTSDEIDLWVEQR